MASRVRNVNENKSPNLEVEIVNAWKVTNSNSLTELRIECDDTPTKTERNEKRSVSLL
jgi:hypothetical protein